MAVYTEVSDADIARTVTEASSLPEACRRLVQAANDAGGDYNISVVGIARVFPATQV